MALVLGVLLLFGSIVSGEALTRYVSPGGTASTCTNPAGPYCNPTTGLNATQIGDELVFTDGLYSQQVVTVRSGTAQQRIVLRAQNPLGAVINWPTTDSGFSLVSSKTSIRILHDYITLRHFDVNGNNGAVNLIEVTGTPRGVQLVGVIVEGNRFRNSGAVGIRVDDARDGLFRHNTIDTTGAHYVGEGLYLETNTPNGIRTERMEFYGNTWRNTAENILNPKNEWSDLYFHHNILENHRFGTGTHFNGQVQVNDGLIRGAEGQPFVGAVRSRFYNNIVRNSRSGTTVRLGPQRMDFLDNVFYGITSSWFMTNTNLSSGGPIQVTSNVFCNAPTALQSTVDANDINFSGNAINQPQSACDADVTRILNERAQLPGVGGGQPPPPPPTITFASAVTTDTTHVAVTFTAPGDVSVLSGCTASSFSTSIGGATAVVASAVSVSGLTATLTVQAMASGNGITVSGVAGACTNMAAFTDRPVTNTLAPVAIEFLRAETVDDTRVAVTFNGPPVTTWATIRTGTFDTGDFSEWDATSISGGTVAVVTGSPGAVDGTQFLRAQLDGTGGTNFARTQWDLPNWTTGQVWRTTFSLYLPTGFLAARTCTFQPVGWDTFPTLGHQMRLMLYQSDGLARMVLVTPTQTQDITSTFSLVEGQWHQIQIAQLLDASDGWTEVRLNGVVVATGTGATYTGVPVTRMRYGFADCSGQTAPLTVYVDAVTLDTGTYTPLSGCTAGSFSSKRNTESAQAATAISIAGRVATLTVPQIVHSDVVTISGSSGACTGPTSSVAFTDQPVENLLTAPPGIINYVSATTVDSTHVDVQFTGPVGASLQACSAPAFSLTISGGTPTHAPTTAILDDCNRTENPLSNSGKWSGPLFGGTQGGMQANGTTCMSDAGFDNSWWNVQTFGPDSEAYALVSDATGTTGDFVAVHVRMREVGAGTADGYRTRVVENSAGTDTIELQRITNTSSTILCSASQEVSDGHGIGVRAVGSTLSAKYYNGTTWSEVCAVTDTTYAAAGYVAISDNGSSLALDDVRGGTTTGQTSGGGVATAVSVTGMTARLTVPTMAAGQTMTVTGIANACTNTPAFTAQPVTNTLGGSNAVLTATHHRCFPIDSAEDGRPHTPVDTNCAWIPGSRGRIEFQFAASSANLPATQIDVECDDDGAEAWYRVGAGSGRVTYAFDAGVPGNPTAPLVADCTFQATGLYYQLGQSPPLTPITLDNGKCTKLGASLQLNSGSVGQYSRCRLATVGGTPARIDLVGATGSR